MKRVSALIVAVMIAVFSIPQLRVYASNDGVVGVYTQESIGTVFSDSTLQSKLSNILLTNEQVNSYDIFSIMETASFSFNPSDILFAVFNSGGGWIVESIDVPEDVNFIYYTSGSSARSGYFYAINDNSSQEVSGRTPVTGHGITNSGVESTITSTLVAYYPWGSGQQGILAGDAVLLYSPIPVVSQEEAISMGAPSSGGTLYNWLLANYDSLTDVRGSGAVFNGTDIVNPSEPEPEIESISNHLYAKNFDVFFCSSEQLINNPYGFASVGGGYLCVQYELDDYALANIGNLVLSFNYSVTFDDHVYTGAYQGRLDSSGYVIIPINQAFQNKPLLLSIPGMCLVCNNTSFYQNYCNMTPYYFTQLEWQGLKNIYEEQGEDNPKLTQFLTTALRYSPFVFVLDNYEPTADPFDIPISSGTVELMKLSDYLTGNLKSTPDLSVAKFDCVCKLLNEQDIFETSGEFKKTINFRNGIGNITDNGITVNPNPFDEAGTFDILPGGYGSIQSSGGTAYATVGNIVNQITFPGYKELKADIDANPDGNFTQFLAPFYNNEVGSWFFSFVDDMPPEMKAILISGCGVGVLFGIARYVRRS